MSNNPFSMAADPQPPAQPPQNQYPPNPYPAETPGGPPMKPPEEAKEEPQGFMARLRGLSLSQLAPYWDVTEEELFARVKYSIVPINNDFFNVVENKPDLFGPFWILTSLIFVITVAGNLSMWLKCSGNCYDFRFVPVAASLVYSVGFIIPLLLWLWGKMLYAQVKYADTVCLYGYALFVFVPATLLCVIDVWLIRAVLILGATGSSALFIFNNLRRLFEEAQGNQKYALMGVMVIGQVMMGYYYLTQFFNYAQIE